MEKDNLVQLFPKKSEPGEPDPQHVLAAMMEYEAAYDRYATAVRRYLKLTGQMNLIRHFLPLD